MRIMRKTPLVPYLPFTHGHFKGQLILDVLIDSRGRIRCVQPASGDREVATSFHKALLEWEFAPFLEQDGYDSIVGTLLVPYDLDNRR